MMLKMIMKTDFTDASSVEMFRTEFGYSVRYGLHVESNLSLANALNEYKDCLGHALGCDGEFDHGEAA